MTARDRDRRVVVVTGGGSGIGAAIAMELGRRGDHVVTVDPMVSVDGSEQLPPPEETTAGRIVAAGGSATASNASVADRDAVTALFDELLVTHGRVDAVVNVAGITRPTGFARGREEDWAAVLAVHVDGYRNVLGAALPAMAAAGRGHVLGVTSGSGWRAADAGAYSSAKRAVASLTWELGRVAPEGVTVNAISPIAMTRMVTEALRRARGPGATGSGAGTGAGRSAPRASGGAATGGLSLGSMPEPEQLGPLAAHLLGHGTDVVHGQVLFAGGPEVAVVAPPRLLEVVRTSDVASVDAVLDAVTASLVAAETGQATTGGANPRFGPVFESPGPTGAAPTPGTTAVRSAVVVGDRTDVVAAVAARLEAAGVTTVVAPPDDTAPAGFDPARAVLADGAARLGHLDAVVVAAATPGPPGPGDGWRAVLAQHEGVVGHLRADAGWARAAADHAAASGGPLRLVVVVDAVTSGGRTRAQSAAQLARAARTATEDRVAAFALAVEAPGQAAEVAALVARLLTADQVELAGSELVVGGGWLGLRSHPRPTGSIVFGGPDLPPWFDDVLRELRP